jgi:hypothetical protein
MADETDHTGVLSEQNIDHLCWLQVQDRAMLTPIEDAIDHYQDVHDVESDVAEADVKSKAQQIGFTIEHLINYGLDVFGRAERHSKILGTWEQDIEPSFVAFGEWAFDPTNMDSVASQSDAPSTGDSRGESTGYDEHVQEDVDPDSEPYEIEWTD